MTQFELMMQRMRYELSLAANITRQEAAAKAIDYYNGEQLEHLDTVLASQFADPKSLKMQPSMDNITRFIGDEISRVFDSPPKLTCDNTNGQALLDKLTADGVLAVTLKVAEVYANLTTVCALYPWWDERTKAIKTTPIPSSSLFVAQRPDDPTDVEAVVFVRELIDTVTGVNTVQYVHWDDGAHFLFDKFGVYTSADAATNPEMINPYGIIPFAFLRDSLAVGEFFGDMDESLISAQETLNVLLTEINQLCKYQGFSQPVCAGIDQKTPIAVDPSKPIRIPSTMRDETPGRFEFVTPQSKIADLVERARALVDSLCERYGISLKAMRDGSTAMSGAALRVSDRRLERRRVDNLPLARMALNRWWEVVKRINNTHGQPEVAIDEPLIIDFAEPQYQDDDATRLANDTAAVTLGTVSPVDIIIRDNPDLTPEEATAKYNANRAFTKAANQRYGLSGLISVPTSTSASPTTQGA
jgi:hypothetical protein